MKRIKCFYVFITLFIFIIVTGCASTSVSHRDASGVLKNQTRTNAGIYKGDK